MSDIKTLKTAQLIDVFTTDMLNSDSGEDNIKRSYSISRSAKELLNKGKEAIPKIGFYLTVIDKILQDVPLSSERECVKRGWVLLLIDLKNKENIHMRSIVTTFEEWRDWALNYRT